MADLIKISDSTSTTSSVVAASSTAVKSAYDLANGKAPKAHASTATTYGIGTGSNYGHVKLSDSTSSTSAASAGIAASPKAVKTAYDLAALAVPFNIQTAGSTTNTIVINQTSLGTFTYTFAKNFYGDIFSTAQISLIPDTGVSKSVTVKVTIGNLTDSKTASSSAAANAQMTWSKIFIPANSKLTITSSTTSSYTIGVTTVTIQGYLK